jgi:hypothetical protein
MTIGGMSGNSVKTSLITTGAIGIGTASPTNALSVEATVASDWVAEFKQGHSTAGQSYGVNVFGGTNATDAAFQVCNQAGSGLLRVTGAGNVGIGTTDPGTFKLAVNGTFKYGSALEQAGPVSGSEPANAPDFTPDAYLDIKVNGQNYLIPLFTKGS